MGERRSGYRDRGGGEQGKYWRPPRSHGNGNFSVPLWEKKFCTDACAIPWGKLCETKKLMPLYKNVVDWDDSAALEAFNDAKARFCAVYHGQPCDIPLPDPNMYIDMVNQDEHVDPELVADLEKSRHRVGPISSKAMKPKYHSEEHSGANNGWRHCRVRNNMHYSYENPGCNQSLAM
uniref:Uncharacterized protein n=1 Tax=Oryza punctata TaxID=4537 RepID=A0A0E0JPV8_ORYPU